MSRIVRPILIELGQETGVDVSSTRENVVQGLEYPRSSRRSPVKQLDAREVVVEGYVRPVNAFALVLSLLDFEDVSIEVILQLFVGIVDEELLEAVPVLEVLV